MEWYQKLSAQSILALHPFESVNLSFLTLCPLASINVLLPFAHLISLNRLLVLNSGLVK